MQIVPMRDLKNTVEIERRCSESNEPVFVTKNGYGKLVVMDIEYYERTMRRIDEATQVNKGIADYEAGRLVDGPKTLAKLRSKHGI
ncbi:Antitoxin Phd_YefM, type II toxin-antitoxin system [Pseudobutyrivibrio sp. NOR37]|uniref:Type II toxin-antitoxin system Phd/YefM family antitoxin n=1 Tax=Pseudobutyrivibrio xylanivorans TaxID=185007 RepID=A0A6M0LCV0_PSEXY|nr:MULTISPECIES: type II toxin-antitoxin system Phd/YefM family antitoxin [Pseudobutyrivibrio]NEX00435.1 type II toxin-antitoxin system Phd/YefM family antitoxin [Pseudobutyrivibrio xylanivorans]SFR59525.1 Antitoxin Phd_YefM, type II toxin-antitoxin system [Pseudobutyrivibrio sp. NOR37]